MELSTAKRSGLVWLLACGALAAQVAPIPRADELPGSPYAIRKTWIIGGSGRWDYLTLDPAARQLFVTHQAIVQVVDLDTGNVAGQVGPFGEAHSVALDPDGQTGYVTDSRSSKVYFFDRRTFRLTGSVELPASPRALVYEPATGMLVAFGALAAAPPAPRNAPQGDGPVSTPRPYYQSLISVIDPRKKERVADVMVSGVIGNAEADGSGQAYFAVGNRREVGRLNISGILELARDRVPERLEAEHASIAADGTLRFDFRTMFGPFVRFFRLGHECEDTRAVALDAPHQRLFAACANQVLKVIATDTGASIAALTIGPGVDAMAYDAARGLIYTANGGGFGSVTVIRQHLTDSYAVIQNLPTLEQARTMAIDPSTGLVYLVTTLFGADLRNPPANGIGTLKMQPVDGSFRVLVVGN